MAFETYRVHIYNPIFRRHITRVCHSVEALEKLVQIYKHRIPGSQIRIKRRSLVFEMVGGVCYQDDPPNHLEESETFLWEAHTIKTVVGAKECFKATPKEVKEKIETAKTDDSIIGMAIFLEEEYEL